MDWEKLGWDGDGIHRDLGWIPWVGKGRDGMGMGIWGLGWEGLIPWVGEVGGIRSGNGIPWIEGCDRN